MFQLPGHCQARRCPRGYGSAIWTHAKLPPTQLEGRLSCKDDIFWHRRLPLSCGERRLQKVTNSHQKLGNLCILGV